MNMNWKEQIKAKLNHEVDGLICETEARIEAAAKRWGVETTDIAVDIGDADPCVRINLRVHKKYEQ